jgi:hypothetical protein
MSNSFQVLPSMIFPVSFSLLIEMMVAVPLMRRPDYEYHPHRHKKTSYAQLDEMMKATPSGVCMYDLPAKFNVNLVDSTFHEPEQSPKVIPLRDRTWLLDGTHDTDEFALDRVFYDRMLKEATQALRPEQCKLFYVPYFNQWETSHFGTWLSTKSRSKLDKELLTYLKHLGRFREPAGIDHIMTLSRIERDCFLLDNPAFKHMTMFVIESGIYDHTKRSGGHPNVHAIPYPTWFRFGKADADQNGPAIAMANASFGSACSHVSATDFVTKACSGKPWCALQVPAEVQGCRVNQIHGTYRCGDAPKQIEFQAKAVSWVQGDHASAGQSAVLGCRHGPCWVWGDCHKPLGEARTGPLVAFVGSDRENANHDHTREPFRYKSIADCQARPLLCVLFDTGSRAYRVLDFQSEKILKMNELLTASVFCLNPPGDTPTRKGTFDSLLAGCIPVIFDEATLSMYEWHLPKWQNVSVYIPPETAVQPDFNVVDYLASLSPDEVRAKQTSIQNVAFSLQYSTTRTPGGQWHMDAFDVAMSKALESTSAAKTSKEAVAQLAEKESYATQGPSDGRQSEKTRPVRKHQSSIVATGATGVLVREN